MRIIGEVEHPKYKISVLSMNQKITIQIEDRLVSQSFVFRDGSGVDNLDSVKAYLTEEFLSGVDKRFAEMNQDYISRLEEMNKEEFDDFEII